MPLRSPLVRSASPPGPSRDRLRLAALLVAVTAIASAAPTPAVADPGPVLGPPPPTVRYERPVAGAVLRRFEAPTSTYGAGHRGVDLGAVAGTRVRAAAGGVVSHAGPVAGLTWVSVAHADGVVTSYGPLVAPVVGRGAPVDRGQVIATLAAGGHGIGAADRGLHWGARRHGVYVDPLSLLDEPPARPSLVGVGAWRGIDHVVQPYEPWAGGRLGGWRYHGSPAADRPGFAVAPTPNHLVQVPGLSSSSGPPPLDPSHLGYDPRSTTTFSYAGGADPGADADDPSRGQHAHGPEHTFDGVDAAARQLRELLRAQAVREPGRAVDLLGHSMGGVVVLRYLSAYHDPYDRTLPPVGHVVTIASPHHGSDLAALGGDVAGHGLVGPLLRGGKELLARVGGPVGPAARRVPMDTQALRDLRPGSPLLRELGRDVEQALHDGAAGPLATGTRILTIAGGGDQVVGAHRTTVPRNADLGLQRHLATGQPLDAALLDRVHDPTDQPWADGAPLEHRVLPGGHRRVLETEAVRETVWRFLAGEEVVDSPGRLAQLSGREGGDTLRLLGGLVQAHDVTAPLRRAASPPTVPGR